MTATKDECCRCGYELVGIDDHQACPECGLLAERSRRVSDELHQSRPRWLRRLSFGVWFVLVALIVPVAFYYLDDPIRSGLEALYDRRWISGPIGLWVLRHYYQVLGVLPLDLAATCVTVGVLLLTSREGYTSADAVDRRMRRNVRLALIGPWVALAMAHVTVQYIDPPFWMIAWWIMIFAVTWGLIPLAVLLALRLRHLARRARSSHLAEHCGILAVGSSLTLAYAFGVFLVGQFADAWGLGANWASRGLSSLVVFAILTVSGALFVLWGLYLMVRFAIAFGAAARRLRQQWKADDRSADAVPESSSSNE